MAGHYITTNQIGNSWCPQIRFEVWTIREDDKYVYYDWYIYYDAHGYAAYTNGRARSISAMVGNGPAYDRSININGITGTKLVAQGSDYVWKQKQQRWVPMTVSFGIDVTWNGSYAGTTYANGGFYIDPITSYSVKYDANGGTGAPGNQLKWYDENITISSTAPTRKGYSFQGWATTNTGSVAYKPGATYSANSSVTLYAIWKADTYPITYDANGGSGAPAAQTKTYGQTLKLSDVVPVRENYNFLGWGTSASSTTVVYSPGADYTGNTTLSLYAIWELAYVPPKIENVVIERCQSDGTEDDFGTCVKVSFDWKCDQTIGENPVREINIQYRFSGDTMNTIVDVPVSGISGKVSQVIGDDLFDIESSHRIYITVADTKEKTTYYGDISSANFTIDFKMGGKGIAFGKPSKRDGFEVKMPSMFEDVVVFKKALAFASEASMPSNINARIDEIPPDISTDPYYSEFLTYSDTGLRPVFIDHVSLENAIWLQGRLASGNATNLLRINADNQVEFDWTKGGPRGRIRKTIWEGTTGDEGQIITIPEQMYYNFFLITHGDRLYGKIPAFRENPGGTGSYITGATIIGNTKEQYGAFVRFQSISETQWKVITSTTNGISHEQNILWPGITLTKIEGVL